MVVKKKRKDINNLNNDLPDAPRFDDFDAINLSSATNAKDLAEVNLSSSENDLERFASLAFTTLLKDNIPPTPSNFQLYFDRLLDEQPKGIKKIVYSMMELEDSNNDEQTIALEQKLKKAFHSVKQILQISSNLYKNTTLMSRILSKRQTELSRFKDPKLKKIVKTLQGDLGKLSSILNKQVENMKTHYQDTAVIVEKVKEESVFDQKFGVYNKRYLLAKLDTESKKISQFNHQSTLVTVVLTNEIKDLIPSEKSVLLMEKIVARLLMKTSRRSDIVAHYSQGVFAMLLRHTDLINAERASNRLVDLVQSTNFFLGEKEVLLSVNIGIASILATRISEETLLAALEAMKEISLIKDMYVKVFNKDNIPL